MTFCVRLTAEASAEAIGGKARSLLRLAAAGLAVPPAFAVTADLFAALRTGGPALPPSLAAPGALGAIAAAATALRRAPWPDGFREALEREMNALQAGGATRFAVRSSAEIEDDATALGAGLFLSQVDVAARDVEAALRAVLASALAPGPIAYLARVGRAPQALGFAALVHPFTRGDASGTAALDPARGEPVIDARSGDGVAAGPALRRALAALAAQHGPVEVEWTSTEDRVTFLQLRPFRAAAARAPADTGGWRWDAAHNPLPLSPAQAGLVELVDARCRIGLAQRVIGGYLFYSPRADRPPPETPISAREALAALEATANARLAGRPVVPLADALELFVALYEPLFGVVQPAARAERRALIDFLTAHGFDPGAHLPALLSGVPSAARARAELARAIVGARDADARASALAAYLDRFGDETPDWDVATPTWRESPGALEQRLRRHAPATATGGNDERAAAEAIAAALPEATRPAWIRLLERARAAAAVAEDDDALYARAQAHVRRALFGAGATLAGAGILDQAGDVFWLPLERLRAHLRNEATLSHAEAAALLAGGRAADARARQAPPSLALATGDDSPRAGIVRGRPGAGGVCLGRVRHWTGAPNDHEAPPAEPEIIVARTILPTELPLVAAAALVVETGGPLDHVAAQARERGIPAVVGAAGACRAFADGDRVLVDGDAGLAARVD